MSGEAAASSGEAAAVEVLSASEEQLMGTSGYFHGQLWRAKAEELVTKKRRPGSFLVRETNVQSPTTGLVSTELVITAYTLPDPDFSEIVHQRVQVDWRGFFTVDGELFFRSVQDLVSHHNLTRRLISAEAAAYLHIPVGREPWELLNTSVQLLQSPSVQRFPFGCHSTGLVWLRDATSASRAAIRSLPVNDMSESRRAFINEATTLTCLPKHPNVVRLFGICLLDDELRVAKELSTLGSLRAFLGNMKAAVELHKSSLCQQLSAAMAFLHGRGFLHLNLQSASFLVFAHSCGNGGYRLKLADLFHSKEGRSARVCKWALEGDGARWASPEVLRCEKATAASDVWSAAVVVWEIHSEGETPYRDQKGGGGLASTLLASLTEGERLHFGRPSFSRRLKAVLSDAWELKPTKRVSLVMLRETLDAELVADINFRSTAAAS